MVRLGLLAGCAEIRCDGREITEADVFHTPRQFVESIVAQIESECGVELPDFLGLKKDAAIALCEDSPLVMVIDVRRYWNVSGLTPLRGDIAFFQGGHVAIVTKPQCRGCRTFECAEMTPVEAEGIPRLVVAEHWESTLTHLVRLVIEAPESGELSTSNTEPSTLNAADVLPDEP